MKMMSSSEKKWLCWYFPSSWLTNFGHGLIVTVVGPTQPYLAQNVGVEIDIINLVWSFGFFGYMVGSLGAGFIFRRYCTNNFRKMMFMAVNMMSTGALMIVLPFVKNFGLLVTIRFLQNIGLGAFITADASLIVYTIGPVKSRPFTMALHALIGIGFLTATFLVVPFLPDELTSKGNEEICNTANATVDDQTTGTNVDILNLVRSEGAILGVQKIAWPFIISGGWCMVASLGYAILGVLPFKMPTHYPESDNSETHATRPSSQVVYWRLLLVLTFVYYMLSCGIERIYQPMAYTYGLCGPLKLSPAEAVITDQSYNGGFMGGRIVSIFIAKIIKPRTMIFTSIVFCIVASAILVAFGGSSTIALYTGTGVLGFFVSWQFGSCYSWVAQKGDITGRLAPLFMIGCGAGSVIFPFISGYVFTSSWGPNGILELTLIVCCVHLCLYASMWMLSRKRSPLTSADVLLEEKN